MTYRTNTLDEAYDELPKGMRALRKTLETASDEGYKALDLLDPDGFEAEMLSRSLSHLNALRALLANVVEAEMLRIIPIIFAEGTNFEAQLRRQARDVINAYKNALQDNDAFEPPARRWFSALRVSEAVRERLEHNHSLFELTEAQIKAALLQKYMQGTGREKPSHARVVHDMAVQDLQAEVKDYYDPFLRL